MDPQAIDQAARYLHEARSVLFITGAGISADSGLPTYRGIGGLYEETDTDEGIPIEVALSGSMFQARPELTWKYIAQIELAGLLIVSEVVTAVGSIPENSTSISASEDTATPHLPTSPLL